MRYKYLLIVYGKDNEKKLSFGNNRKKLIAYAIIGRFKRYEFYELTEYHNETQ